MFVGFPSDVRISNRVSPVSCTCRGLMYFPVDSSFSSEDRTDEAFLSFSLSSEAERWSSAASMASSGVE